MTVRLSERKTSKRVEIGKGYEWRILEVTQKRLQSQITDLLHVSDKVDIEDKLDGIFVVGGEDLTVQSKSREKPYRDIGVEIAKRFGHDPLDIIKYPGRDYISAYKYYACLGWEGSCLLYTSPSPRDRQKSRMPSSA